MENINLLLSLYMSSQHYFLLIKEIAFRAHNCPISGLNTENTEVSDIKCMISKIMLKLNDIANS